MLSVSLKAMKFLHIVCLNMNNKTRALHKKLCQVGNILYRIDTAALSSHVAAGNFINIVEDEKKKTANIVMQKPPVNSFNYEFLSQLTSSIKSLEEKNFRGFVLSSSSPTVFSAGLDITELCNPKEERLRLFWTSLHTMWKTLYMTPLISIAAINGHSPGGGCLLALSCDHSIMVKSKSIIGLNETMLGLVGSKWIKDLYIGTLGFKVAEHALNLGKLFTPEEALKLHIVNELADSPSELNDKAQSEMDKWLKIPDSARRLTKISLRKPHVEELESYEQQEVENIVKFFSQEKTQKMLQAYMKSLKKK